jgi:hypothetical protein
MALSHFIQAGKQSTGHSLSTSASQLRIWLRTSHFGQLTFGVAQRVPTSASHASRTMEATIEHASFWLRWTQTTKWKKEPK